MVKTVVHLAWKQVLAEEEDRLSIGFVKERGGEGEFLWSISWSPETKTNSRYRPTTTACAPSYSADLAQLTEVDSKQPMGVD